MHAIANLYNGMYGHIGNIILSFILEVWGQTCI